MQEPNRIGVYHTEYNVRGLHKSYYEFRVGVRGEFEKKIVTEPDQDRPTELNFLKSAAIPPEFKNELKEFAGLGGKKIGYIRYRLNEEDGKKVAVSIGVFPKKQLKELMDKNSVAPTLGSFLEEQACDHLQENLGATHARTTLFPTGSRTKQITDAGLPIGIPIEMSEWIRLLREGREKYLKAHFKKN